MVVRKSHLPLDPRAEALQAAEKSVRTRDSGHGENFPLPQRRRGHGFPPAQGDQKTGFMGRGQHGHSGCQLPQPFPEGGRIVLVRARDDEKVRLGQGGCGLPQAPGGKQGVSAERIGRIHQDDIQVAVNGIAPLKTVVQHEDIAAASPDRHLRGAQAVRAHHNRRAGQALGQEVGFVAGRGDRDLRPRTVGYQQPGFAAAAPVPAGKHGGTEAAVQQAAAYEGHGLGLSGPADGDVSHGYRRRRQAPLPGSAPAGAARSHGPAVAPAQPPEQGQHARATPASRPGHAPDRSIGLRPGPRSRRASP